MGDFPAKILVATDGSEDAMLAARAAISLVHDTGAELHVVHVGPKHVYPPPTAGPTPPTGTDRELRQEAQGVLDWQVDEITKAGGEITQVHLRMGRPAEEIMRLSEELVVGLIGVGNQGLGGRFSRMGRFLMGSVSEKVSRYALLGDGSAQRPVRTAPRLIRHRSLALLEGVREANRSSRRLGEGLRVEDAGQDLDCSTSMGAGGVDFPRPRPFSWPYSIYCRVEVFSETRLLGLDVLASRVSGHGVPGSTHRTLVGGIMRVRKS